MKITKEKRFASFAFVLLMVAVMLPGMLSPAYAAESAGTAIADFNGKTIGVPKYWSFSFSIIPSKGIPQG